MGKTDAEIANARGVARRTVINQLVALRAKLGASSRRDLLSRLATVRLSRGDRSPSTEASAWEPQATGSGSSSPWGDLMCGRFSLVGVHDAASGRVLTLCPAPAANGALRRVSEREHEVLTLAASGMSTKGIAHRLGVTTSTVSSHLQSARQKTGAANLAWLIVAQRLICGASPSRVSATTGPVAP